jgi:hypothetical protein
MEVPFEGLSMTNLPCFGSKFQKFFVEILAAWWARPPFRIAKRVPVTHSAPDSQTHTDPDSHTDTHGHTGPDSPAEAAGAAPAHVVPLFPR